MRKKLGAAVLRLTLVMAVFGAGYVLSGCQAAIVRGVPGGDGNCSDFMEPCNDDGDCCGGLPCIDGVCL